MPVEVPTQDEFAAATGGKPPPPDQQLEQRVTALETEMAAVQGEVSRIDAELDGVEADVLEIDARVTALEETDIDPPDPEPEPPDPEPEPEPPDPPLPGELRMTITMAGKVYTFDETDGVDLGNYVDPANRFTMTCRRVSRADTALTVDFRRIDGWSCAIVAYGDPNSASNANLPGYRAEIEGKSFDLPGHWKFARWRWQSGPWPLPMVSVSSLVNRKLLPRFDASVNQGSASPRARQSYVPMGMAGIYPYMPGTGGRPDIGLVTDWQAEYLCTGSADSLATTLAQGEAGGTIPWYVRDPATGAVVDPTSPEWDNASFYGTSGKPQLVSGQGGDTCLIRFSGTPGATIQCPANWPGGPITVYDGNAPRQEWWCYGVITIGADGWVDAPANYSGGIGKPPIAPMDIKSDAQISAPTTVAPVDGSRITGSGITIDISHEPAVAYLPFLLTGDPYFLETLQAQVIMIALMASGGWAAGSASWPPGMGQTRGVAWATRDHWQAAAVTPDTVPGWLLPKSVMRTMFQRCIDGLNLFAQSSEPVHAALSAVAGSRGRDPVTGPGGTFPPNCSYATWQEDFVQWVIAAGSGVHPELADAVRWHLKGLIARVNPDGGSGWCGGYPELYGMGYQNSEAGPQFGSWAEAYENNARVFGWTYCQSLDELFLNPSSYDYPNGLQAALSVAWQAGFEEAKPALDVLAASLEAGIRAGHGGKEWKYSLYRGTSVARRAISPSAEIAFGLRVLNARVQRYVEAVLQR